MLQPPEWGPELSSVTLPFTKDGNGCRHAQNDLQHHTNIVAVPEFERKCTQPFVPADPATDTPARAECRHQRH